MVRDLVSSLVSPLYTDRFSPVKERESSSLRLTFRVWTSPTLDRDPQAGREGTKYKKNKETESICSTTKGFLLAWTGRPSERIVCQERICFDDSRPFP